ncbi:MAG: peptide ABC transporter substrate-binding protein, partial [Treponema sp.]|nr:peptide ABC transporter substrate-binding protein [Treponema sp.]
MKTRTLIFASLFFLLASTFAQNSQNDFSPQQEDAPDPLLQKSFTIVDAPHQYDLNPHTASYSSEAQILTNIYEGLFSYHPATLEPQYALATSHRISRNKLRWTFTLRENARFSDGFPLTAHDVKEAWLNLLAEKNAPYASLLDIIQGAAEYRNGKGLRSNVSISALNDTTLT